MVCLGVKVTVFFARAPLLLCSQSLYRKPLARPCVPSEASFSLIKIVNAYLESKPTAWLPRPVSRGSCTACLLHKLLPARHTAPVDTPCLTALSAFMQFLLAAL